jgi:hypothetical protein
MLRAATGEGPISGIVSEKTVQDAALDSAAIAHSIRTLIGRKRLTAYPRTFTQSRWAITTVSGGVIPNPGARTFR